METVLLQKSLLELIRRTSAELPADVVRAVEKGHRREAKGSTAKYAMKVILRQHRRWPRARVLPLCQDTGTIICYVDLPEWVREETFRRTFDKAVAEATRIGYLRQNSVDSLTGKNSGTNLGPGSPSFHFEPGPRAQPRGEADPQGRRLRERGRAVQPARWPDLGAGRDLEGVHKCILDCVVQAQGKGCGPGILGVCIGGDRGTGYVASQGRVLPTAGRRERRPASARPRAPDRVRRRTPSASAPWASAARRR